MKKTIKRSARLTLLAPLMLFGFGGSKHRPRVECGGTTVKTDHNAPKEIKSKDITDLHVTFYLQGNWSSFERKEHFSFDVKPNENGELTVTELTENMSVPADKELLIQLQQVVDETRLALSNGVYKVTAGLPPPYQPCYVTINYASGEQIQFTENNNPDAKWAKAMYLTFANWFTKHGNDKLMPPVYKGVVDRVRLELVENGVYTTYTRIVVLPKDAIDGKRNLFGKSIYDSVKKQDITDEFILFPDDFYEKVGGIISNYDMCEYDRCSVFYAKEDKDEQDTDDGRDKLSLHIHHEDNHQINIDTTNPERIEKLRPLVSDLMVYYDHLFATAEKKTGR